MKNLKDARLYTQLSILGSIPLLENDIVVQRRKQVMWVGWATAAMAGLAIMAGSVAHYYMTRDRSMSRVHDALRKAAQESPHRARTICCASDVPRLRRSHRACRVRSLRSSPAACRRATRLGGVLSLTCVSDIEISRKSFGNATNSHTIPLKDALLVNPAMPREAPAEEFRSLRTRLNHLQTVQPLHTLVVTSASPAEGKSFTATNLAVTQSQLADKRVLLADFDFRRPTVKKTFQISIVSRHYRLPAGKAPLREHHAESRRHESIRDDRR